MLTGISPTIAQSGSLLALALAGYFVFFAYEEEDYSAYG